MASIQIETNQLISEQLIKMLEQKENGKTLCPSEVVRAIDNKLPNGWRAEMLTVRTIAYNMARQGLISIFQKGISIPLDQLDYIRGPIRLGLSIKTVACIER